jgi:hypothetical protein
LENVYGITPIVEDVSMFMNSVLFIWFLIVVVIMLRTYRLRVTVAYTVDITITNYDAIAKTL